VTISDLLYTSDKNESIADIVDVLEDAESVSHKFRKILIVAEDENDNLVMWQAGLNSRDVIYIAEVMKHRAVEDEIYDTDEDEDGLEELL
jgi:hypothetical protein